MGIKRLITSTDLSFYSPISAVSQRSHTHTPLAPWLMETPFSPRGEREQNMWLYLSHLRAKPAGLDVGAKKLI